MLTCPVCSLPLSEEEKRVICPHGHSFDRARQGHINLLTDSSGKGNGDDMAMLLARRSFLEKGHYDGLARTVAESVCKHFPEDGVFLDAGCGEGYYTQKIASALEYAGKKAQVYAFDIAKDAARLTSVRMAKKGRFFVASTFRIPMADASASVITSLFAPYSEAEFLRVLAPGGILIRAVPLSEHLYSLKCAVYEHPTKNEAAAAIGDGFEILSETRVQGKISLGSPEEIRSLFYMTPYAHKTSREDMKKLESLETLETETDFGVLIYRKKL